MATRVNLGSFGFCTQQFGPNLLVGSKNGMLARCQKCLCCDINNDNAYFWVPRNVPAESEFLLARGMEYNSDITDELFGMQKNIQCLCEAKIENCRTKRYRLGRDGIRCLK